LRHKSSIDLRWGQKQPFDCESRKFVQRDRQSRIYGNFH
jgi:hypothetical protein